MSTPTITRGELEHRLEEHRVELRGYCYRMLASPADSEDAVQETFIRAWRGIDRFQGRASLRSWLYRIATNVCLDMLKSVQRRARPMDLGPAREPVAENLHTRPETTWLEPIPDSQLTTGSGDPAEIAVTRDSVRLAFIAALQHLPPRQRAALILAEVLEWSASEIAALLGTSVPAVNSALQRARATLADHRSNQQPTTTDGLNGADRDLLNRYVHAFEAYDIDALTTLIHQDATQSMPPYDLWLAGRDDIFTWWFGPGIGCRGSVMIPTSTANGSPAYGQYKPAETGGHEPWALQVLELTDGTITELTFFLNTPTLFPLFGLPARLNY